MSREIKFRVWDKVDCVMNGVTAINWKQKHVNIAPVGLLGMNRVDIMQYTGLKDANGKEAYEGDIYTCGHRYSDGTHKYGDRNLIEDIKTFNPEDSFEIIGNVFENPELLSSTNI